MISGHKIREGGVTSDLDRVVTEEKREKKMTSKTAKRL